jgi:hypothetical protein
VPCTSTDSELEGRQALAAIVGVAVGVAVWLEVEVGVAVGVPSRVGVDVGVGVGVPALVGVDVGVGVGLPPWVGVEVGVTEEVAVAVGIVLEGGQLEHEPQPEEEEMSAAAIQSAMPCTMQKMDLYEPCIPPGMELPLAEREPS